MTVARLGGVAVGLETSSRAASVAVRRGELFLEESLSREGQHASDLLPALDRLLSELGARPAEITAIAVGTGPGSYTGLRVGVATALGLARGTGARLRGVPSGEALAWRELTEGEQAIVLLDARQGELYFAHYERLRDDVVARRAACVTTPDRLPEILPDPVPIFGEAGIERAARLDASALACLRTDVVPRAGAVLELGLLRLERDGPHTPAELEPLYLRAFAAKARKR